MDDLIKVFFRDALEYGSYISILETKRGRFYPVVRMRRKDARDLQVLHAAFPGYRGITRERNGRVTQWLNYQDKKAYDLLKEMVDVLDKKKPQAQLVLEFQKSGEEYRRKHGVSAKLTSEERTKRRNFIERICELNNKIPIVPLEMEGAMPLEDEQKMFDEMDRMDGTYVEPTNPEPPAADQEEFNIFDLK